MSSWEETIKVVGMYHERVADDVEALFVKHQ